MPLSVPLDRLSRADDLLRNRPAPGPSTLPVQNPTSSFWLSSDPDANPLAHEGSKGPLTSSTDVCIIGSGISGVSAAYHLSKLSRESGKALDVVILEAREFCSGATGRNGGHLTPAIFFDFIERSERYGEEEALKMISFEQYNANFLLDLINAYDWTEYIDLVHGGHAKMIVSEKEKAQCLADFQAAKVAGFDHSKIHWLTESEANTRFGTKHETILFDSYNLWPSKLVTKLFQLTRSPAINPSKPNQGWFSRTIWGDQSAKDLFQLVLHTHIPALWISRSEVGKRWKITTHRGDVNCNYIIHAANAYTSHLLPHLSGPSGIIPVRAQVLAIRSGVSLEELTSTAWSANEGFEYWFPRPLKDTDNKPLVILGGGREIPDDHELYITDDSTLNPDISSGLRNFLPSVFPEKFEQGREPEMEWTGIMGYTAFKDPMVGPVQECAVSSAKKQFEGQYISAGFSGHGMTRAPACAEVVARLLWHDFTKANSVFEVPSWMPRAYLTRITTER